MPTSQLAGSRTHRSRNVRDVTGRRYEELHAEQKAKEDAEHVDIAAVRRAALTEGHAQGFAAGLDAGLDAATEALLSLSEKDLLAKRAEYIAEYGGGDA
jgi:flagellar biosynthesis/type III secretory pathway protein FliH